MVVESDKYLAGVETRRYSDDTMHMLSGIISVRENVAEVERNLKVLNDHANRFLMGINADMYEKNGENDIKSK